MRNTILPFDELMKAVLEQLKSQKYVDATLTVYRRTYNRIHIFLNHHGTDIYTHELGKAFLADSNVSKSTFVAYACAVRRLDDYIDGKPYRCHHGDYNEQIPLVFMGLRAGDIAKLKLSEINFSTGYISITQEKTGIPLTLQMPCEVVNAISMHLDNDKYSLEDGYVFHSLKAPYGRITTSIIQHALNECFAAANVNTAGKKHGPHAFRSSLASSMVNDNASYEVVRRILGHSNTDVIKHYAKADIENLRMCSIDPQIPTGIFRDYLSGKVL